MIYDAQRKLWNIRDSRATGIITSETATARRRKMPREPKVPTFTLKCVGCNIKEDRPAAECREQPFCTKCYMPMVLEKVKA